MMKFIALPTWLLTRLLLKLVQEDHPWWGWEPTLAYWYLYRNSYTREVDSLLWYFFLFVVVLYAF